ncbi:CRE-NCX-1 protein [Aphelenchoides avenae]|nr:CRE-NCX-1 protein [Aphelenchus avenae]
MWTLLVASFAPLLLPPTTSGQEVVALFSTAQRSQLPLNATALHEEECAGAKPCKPGVLLPVWEPQEDLTTSDVVFRAFVYFIAMGYLFFGVSIVADRFMAAIEVITSQEREVTIKKVTGETTTVLVRVWNETVSNLTLMALGSSAPEILLSVIEIFGNGFEAGDLGPSTIVGSAAFNLFVIIGICIAVVPSKEIRRVDRIDVFWVTVTWSTFAYVWLFLILSVISPNVVEVWEGVLTFLFFPLTVMSAFVANKHAKSFGQRLMATPLTSFARRQPLRAGAPRKAGNGLAKHNGDAEASLLNGGPKDADTVAFEDHRKKYLEIFKRLRAENPDLPIGDLEKLATAYVVSEAPKSRAFYRIQASGLFYARSRLGLAKCWVWPNGCAQGF